MENEVVICCRDMTKHFKVYLDKGPSLKEQFLSSRRRRYEERAVLNGISFDVHRGEAVGLIGENGCGKSTTLKLLSRIMYPDSGSIDIKGRVSALIELGAGFHPDMSGRENIYTNASVFGLKKEEIDARLQTIIDFSELGPYIDNPVRTYSSGMYMRLAFSVAINVDADILLVDEILAVGDAAFQAKCFNRLREIQAAGTTIVIVSHSLGQVEQICDRSIWICDGRIRAEGKPRDVHPAYLDFMSHRAERLAEQKAAREQAAAGKAPEEPEKKPETPPAAPADPNRWGSGEARIQSVRILNAAGDQAKSFSTGSAMRIELSYVCANKLQEPAVGIGIFRNDGLQCYGTNTQLENVAVPDLGEKGTVSVTIGRMLLLPGEYSLDVDIHKSDGFAYDYWRYAIRFTVYSDQPDAGVARLEHTWHFDAEEGTGQKD